MVSLIFAIVLLFVVLNGGALILDCILSIFRD